MKIDSCYPVLMTDNPEALAEFYTGHFGFETSFSSDWYVSLRSPGEGAFELAFLAPDHESVPEGYGRPSGGVIVNIETDDAAGAWKRLVGEAGLPVRRELRDEVWGQRHFILADPAGNLVDVIENTEPGEEYKAAYTG